MAREHARVKLSIWEDDDFRSLTSDAQHLYFVLLTHPTLDYCGVVDWRPGKIAGFAHGWTAEHVEMAGKELADALYLVIDEGTEEVLLRSFVRHDGLLREPNLAVAMRKAHAAISSSTLRGVIVHELIRLHAEKPELKGWPKVTEMLEKASVNPSDCPSFYPSGNPSPDPSVEAEPKPSDNPSVTGCLTTSPSPTPSPTPPSGAARKRRGQLPGDWKPSTEDIAWQREQGISDLVARQQLEVFRDHWKSNAEAKADWSATWRNWLRRRDQFRGGAPARNGTTGTDPVTNRPKGAGWQFGMD